MDNKENFIEELYNKHGFELQDPDKNMIKVDLEVESWKNSNLECEEDYTKSIAELEKYKDYYCHFCVKIDGGIFCAYAIVNKNYKLIDIVYM